MGMTAGTAFPDPLQTDRKKGKENWAVLPPLRDRRTILGAGRRRRTTVLMAESWRLHTPGHAVDGVERWQAVVSGRGPWIHRCVKDHVERPLGDEEIGRLALGPGMPQHAVDEPPDRGPCPLHGECVKLGRPVHRGRTVLCRPPPVATVVQVLAADLGPVVSSKVHTSRWGVPSMYGEYQA